MKKIAIIEDDIGLNNGIKMALKQDDFEFLSFYTLSEVRDIEQMDLIILDINLPDGDGMEFLQKIRKTSQVPVLILTANDSEFDEVCGLKSGADDYMTKPFSLMVLRVRVEKLLNQERKAQSKEQSTYIYGDLALDFTRMDFKKGNVKVELSKTEQRLLYYLIANAGQTLKREQILDYVWEDAEFIDENALSVTIKRLRDKVENEDKKYIRTIYGIGYMWDVGM